MCLPALIPIGIAIGEAVASAAAAVGTAVGAVGSALGSALVGTAAVEGGAAATAGIFGAGGVFAAGLTAGGGAAVSAGSIAGTAANVIGLGGTILSGVSSIVQGQQAQATAEYNAKIQKMQALDAERRGSIAEGQKRTQYQLFIGKQRAIMGASGIVPDEGSFGDILAQSAEYGERNAQQVRANAAREAWGHRAQADLYDYEGDQAATAGYMKAGTTMLGGAYSLLKQNPSWWQGWTSAPSKNLAATINQDSDWITNQNVG